MSVHEFELLISVPVLSIHCLMSLEVNVNRRVSHLSANRPSAARFIVQDQQPVLTLAGR
jgi:hypothetical protein